MNNSYHQQEQHNTTKEIITGGGWIMIRMCWGKSHVAGVMVTYTIVIPILSPPLWASWSSSFSVSQNERSQSCAGSGRMAARCRAQTLLSSVGQRLYGTGLSFVLVPATTKTLHCGNAIFHS